MRLPSIDVLRSLAIVLMVVVHFVENLSGSYGSDGGPFLGADRYWWLPTGFAAPLFTFLAGVSYRIWLEGQVRRGRDDTSVSKMTIRRGLFLCLLGLVFNVLVWMPEDVFNWDILTLIGTALLVLDVVRRMPPLPAALAAAVVVAMSPTLRGLADYPAAWTDGYFDYEFTLEEVVLGFLVTGYFPVFPWIAFPVAGYLAAPMILTPAPSRARRMAAPLLAGMTLLAAAAATPFLRSMLPAALVPTTSVWSMFPASTTYVLGTLGATVVALTLLHRLLDGDGDRPAIALPLAASLGRHSLSIYVLHHLAHVWPLWVWGLVQSGDITSLWQVAMPPAQAVAWASLFLVVALVVARWMDRPGAPSAESALRWLSDP
jgi:uncharacterized membrane protein